MTGISRSFLFVPGDRAERFDKAAASGFIPAAKLYPADLEDAVAPEAKAQARTLVREWLATRERAALVRINSAGTPWFDDDVRMLQATPQGAAITPAGTQWFAHVGIDTSMLGQQRRMVCRPCLDWSERRHHLGGALGAALLQCLFDGGWAHRAQDSRVVHFTPKGELALRQWLATHPDAPNPSAAQGPAPC